MKLFQRMVTVVALALLVVRPLFAADPVTESLRSLKGEAFDQAFLQHMIDHHRHGIEMAKIVPHHSQNQGLTQLAEQMTDMQQEDIQQMTTLLGGSKGSGHADMDHAQMDQMHKTSMSKLEQAQGAQFDQSFVKEMTKHHSDGLEMAQLAAGRATRSEVREIASKIAEEQKDDIKKLKRINP